jgi:hypothetical protein|tara:strand:+ start:376 stop:1218 length:843 start_codon:yes stop_codon:yes gene_type:complete
MALAQEITQIVTVGDSSNSLRSTYFFINAVEVDTTTDVGYKIVEYYVYFVLNGVGTDPSISGKTAISVSTSTDYSASGIATALKNALDGLSNFSASVGVGAGNDNKVTVTNTNRGSVTDASDFNTGFTISTTTQGTGQLAGNIKYPEASVNYFIRGDHMGIITNYDSESETRTARKSYTAIDHNIVNGLLIHYYGNPKRVTAITDTPDVDNLFHSAIVDYVKKCLYMDRAGTATDGNIAQVAMGLMAQHERSFNNAVKKYGTRKRSKTGGTRAVVPADFK